MESAKFSGSATFSGSASKHTFLQHKFQVGSANSDRVNYTLAQKFFHKKDVRPEVLEAKKIAVKSKQSNILGTEPKGWNASVAVSAKESTVDLKRQLLKVRAGLMDEKVQKESKFHTDERIAEQRRFIVSCTGQGPIGKLTGKWFNPVDERGLCSHCIAEHWPDWNQSHSCHTKEDIKLAQTVTEAKEMRRTRMMGRSQVLNNVDYVHPTQAVSNVNDILRQRKIDFQDLKEQFKRELKVEFPQASEERLQAMAQRLLNEKLLADEKIARFPVQHESFRPNLSLTSQDRRYKEYFHPGSYTWMDSEKRYGWSCCLNFEQDSRGCEHKMVNPDAWCTK
eukprot:CAMPEP_0176128244 /NCGR_PEP_ID=MMETSP0120_2-20121206/64796_1 /TAXON_ID=160619 /ORGANISM="Kryptoperidinium foliaceum, Strain CCMP 1326" /LENGTH=336 /DNA_ID=CAMNT_0017463325 /DNA_START=30 /DNA_END=1037 /DNA_ORIENTATION=-